MATPNKRIPELQETFTPSSSGYTVYDDGQITYKIAFDTLTEFINSSDKPTITGGTFNSDSSEIIFTTSNGSLIIVTGVTSTTKHWLENQDKIIKDDETIVISGNYVLYNTNLTLNSNNNNIIIGNLVFNKYAQIFIGGNLLLKDSNIINNGLISVAGGIILSGDSTIIGTGIII